MVSAQVEPNYSWLAILQFENGHRIETKLCRNRSSIERNIKIENQKCEILPKKCRVAPSPLRHVASLIPPEYIISGILLRRHSIRTEILTHSTRMSHSRNYIRPTFHLIRISHIRIRPTFHLIRISHIRIRMTFHLLRIFHIRRLLPDGRGGRFNFPGQTCPDTLVTLTWTAWLVRRSRFAGLSRFAGSSSAHNQKAPTILTTKSPELSLIFNARYIR